MGKQFAIQVCRIDLFQRRRVALLPMPDQVAIEPAGPSGSAFQESEIELWKAPRNAAQEQCLTYRLSSDTKMTYMVINGVEGDKRVPTPLETE
jgi:hypothetical protein